MQSGPAGASCAMFGNSMLPYLAAGSAGSSLKLSAASDTRHCCTLPPSPVGHTFNIGILTCYWHVSLILTFRLSIISLH